MQWLHVHWQLRVVRIREFVRHSILGWKLLYLSAMTESRLAPVKCFSSLFVCFGEGGFFSVMFVGGGLEGLFSWFASFLLLLLRRIFLCTSAWSEMLGNLPAYPPKAKRIPYHY